jgi:hypothetical protein
MDGMQMHVAVQQVLIDDAKLSPVGERAPPMPSEWTWCIGSADKPRRHKTMNLVDELGICTGTG